MFKISYMVHEDTHLNYLQYRGIHVFTKSILEPLKIWTCQMKISTLGWLVGVTIGMKDSLYCYN